MTAPIHESEVVMGKFLGSLGFLTILLLPTIFYVLMLRIYARPDFGPILSGYLGILLVGALFIAVGLFCSSLTRSQIVAAVAAAAILCLVTMVPWWVGSVATLPTFWRNVIDQTDLKQHVTLVSLYTNVLNDADANSMSQRVNDLLDEYKRHSSKIDVKVIDPVTQKDKLESLHQDFINKYGGQIKSYKDYLENWKKQFAQVQKLTAAEADAVRPFAPNEAASEAEPTGLSEFVRTIGQVLPQRLDDAKDAVDRELARKHPDYKAAVNTARNQVDVVSKLADQIIQQTPKAQSEPTLPAAFRKYLADALPRYQQIKKLCDDMIASADKLGELKVDQLEQALNVDNPILVLGDNEWRIIPYRQVWQEE